MIGCSAALYARVSSDQQAQQATVGSQVVELKQRAEADGCLVLPQDIYVDEGFSGAALIRPSLERLRDRIAEGGIETLYVHSPDRLARKYAYQVLLLEEFRKCGVKTVFLHGPVGQTAEDELLIQVQGMIAEYERAKILERSRRGKIHRARQGSINVLASAPYGYLYVRKSGDEPASYRVLLHEAKVVRTIFESLVQEQKSLNQIARQLNAEGVSTRTGVGPWRSSTVRWIAGNPAYMGKAAFGKTEQVERVPPLRPIRGNSPTPRNASRQQATARENWIWINVPAIITPELFEAAQEQLVRNQRLSARNMRGERYLLQGLTVCARCGYAFYAREHKQHGRRYRYYRCSGGDALRYVGGRVCDNSPIRGDQLELHVWQSVTELLLNPDRVLDEWSRRQRSDGQPAELRDRRDDAARGVANCERTLKRLGTPTRRVPSVSMSSRAAAKLYACASSVLAKMSNRPSAQFARRPIYVRL